MSEKTLFLKEFNFIKNSLIHIDKRNSKVSKASLGWHLDHSLKVINNVLVSLKESNSENFVPHFSFKRNLILMLGVFPRGKVKSPKRVLPPEIIEKEEIENQLNQVIKKLESINIIEKEQFFTHPIFKDLNKKQTIRFLQIHTNHHLKIIKDILK
jgi:hypothetical protein